MQLKSNSVILANIVDIALALLDLQEILAVKAHTKATNCLDNNASTIR